MAHAESGLGNEDLIGRIVFVDRAFVGQRQLHGAADDGDQHGLQIERGIHRAQHLLQCLQFGDRAGQLRGALPQVAGSSRAGDGDHRLLGEGPQQRDLAVGEATPVATLLIAKAPIAMSSRSSGIASDRLARRAPARTGSESGSASISRMWTISPI